ARGIPWKGRLNEDAVAVAANSLVELFDQLSLNEDPFNEESDQYAHGKKIVQRIVEVEAQHPELANKLKDVVRSSIVDWRGVIQSADLTGDLSPEKLKALRLALEFAVKRRDVGVIDQLHQKAAPFNETLHGTGGVLHLALTDGALD